MSNDIVSNDINYDDIPELTKEDFSKGIKNPFAGKFKEGYTIIVEHADHDEIITVTKKIKPKNASGENHLRVAEEVKPYKE